MDRDDPLSLLVIHFAKPDQLGGNLAGSFDFGETVNRRYVLVRQVVNHINIVLQAIRDQAADGVFVQYPTRGVMGIIDHQRAAPLPGRVQPGQVLHFSNHGVNVKSQRGRHRDRMDPGKALFVGPAQVRDHHFGNSAMKAKDPQRRAI